MRNNQLTQAFLGFSDQLQFWTDGCDPQPVGCGPANRVAGKNILCLLARNLSVTASKHRIFTAFNSVSCWLRPATCRLLTRNQADKQPLKAHKLVLDELSVSNQTRNNTSTF